MKLICQECGTIIKANDINLKDQIAKCMACNEVFSFKNSNTIENQTNDFDIRKAIVPLPKRFTVKELNGNLEIKMSWFTWINLFLTFFAIFWNSFMIAWFAFSISSGKWGFALFGTIHAGVGFYLLYMVVAKYINSTTVIIDSNELSVKIGPLPWPGNHSVKLSDIIQLYSKCVVSQGKNSTVSYEVHSILKNGTHLCLIKSLEDNDQALYFEQKIEEKLHITDEPVIGEMDR